MRHNKNVKKNKNNKYIKTNIKTNINKRSRSVLISLNVLNMLPLTGETTLRWKNGKDGKCPKCGKIKLLTEFYEYDTGGNTHTYWCKECIEFYVENVLVGAN